MTAAPPLTSGIPVLAIGGPTCTGKTELALAVARAVDGELVGADSMQVYRGMDIGTATPRPEELGGVAHHMLGVVAPDQPYDAAAFARDADRAIADIAARGKRVIVVGGTGLYLRVLLRGLQGAPGPEPGIRAEIMDRAGRDGWPALHAELGKLDPATARRLHPNDGVRILRALEVVRQSGVPMSEWQARHGFSDRRYPFALLGVDRDKDELARRIDARVDGMLAAGFLEEVRALLGAGYGPTLKPMQGLGYKRLCEHLAGEVTLEEARDKIQADTRRLAKRQRTWFRGEPDLLWLPPDPGEIIGAARVFFAEH
ncbi:MAG: tRNA (adenosine(37)-N6)-dimethylallyltransferase MiaA [Proteobacteria bacterium]|jgi:tRNA dimethylallyltransferase|nr:tRNA (adenosine(37)-N6)-dimethylallyltransferase MiaA [Pseudomonadota bacterium]